MGVLKDKKSGKWYYRVKHNGKDYEKWFGKGPAAKFEAESAMAELQHDIHIGKLSGQGWECFDKMRRAKNVEVKTFGEAAKEYLDGRLNYKTSSVRAYRSILKAHLLPKFEKRALNSITETDLRKFLVELTEEKGLAASRANTILQPMREMLAQACREGVIPRDPGSAVKRLKVAKTKVQPFSEEDLALALANIDEHYRPFFIVQAFTGARPNELLALRWSDIDWVNHQISISKGRVRGYEGLPKTSSGERLVPMTKPVDDALKQLKDQGVAALDGFVFVNTKGRPIDNHLGDVWDRALKRARLAHRPSYQLRHTFITQCILKGFPLPYIAKIVGHSTIDTLIRHYTRWIDKATQEQEDKLKKSFTLLDGGTSITGGIKVGNTRSRSRKRPNNQLLQENLEIRGFEPLTSRVRSVRSTN